MLLDEITIRVRAGIDHHVARVRPKEIRVPRYTYASIMNDMIHDDPMIFHLEKNRQLGRDHRTAEKAVELFWGVICQCQEDADAQDIRGEKLVHHDR